MNGLGKLMMVVDWVLVVVICILALVWVYSADMPVIVKDVPAGGFRVYLVHFADNITGIMTFVVLTPLLLVLNGLVLIRLIRKASYQRSIKF